MGGRGHRWLQLGFGGCPVWAMRGAGGIRETQAATERGESAGQLSPALVPLGQSAGPGAPALLPLPPGGHLAFPSRLQTCTELVLGARLGGRGWLRRGEWAQVPLLQQPPSSHGRSETLWPLALPCPLLHAAQQTAVGKGGCSPHRGRRGHFQQGLQPSAAARSGLWSPGSRGGMEGSPRVCLEAEALVEDIPGC